MEEPLVGLPPHHPGCRSFLDPRIGPHAPVRLQRCRTIRTWPRFSACGNVNRNLKWAVVETGNLIVINQRRLAGSHVVRLYQRIKRAKNHQKAVVAVARHLAEAAWWVLTKQEVYREPRGPRQALSSAHG